MPKSRSPKLILNQACKAGTEKPRVQGRKSLSSQALKERHLIYPKSIELDVPLGTKYGQNFGWSRNSVPLGTVYEEARGRGGAYALLRRLIDKSPSRKATTVKGEGRRVVDP